MTYQVSACPCCGAIDLNSRSAVLSPFIAAFVFDRQPATCTVCSCAHCGLVFFATRYEEAEISRLYDGYRGERYLAIRRHFEPWYTRSFNERIGGPAGMAPRQLVYRQTLAEHASSQPLRRVLDYAGDRGQLMAGGPGEAHFVFDISGALPVEGVTNIASESALEAASFDLVLLCGVVEHFSAPLAEVKKVLEYVKPGGLLYVEVPDEQYLLKDIPKGAWYERYLRRLTGKTMALLLFDFWSTVIRVKVRRIPPLGFVKQHEHLNFFDLPSLKHLLATAGLDVLVSKRASGALIALCQRPPAEPIHAT